MSWRRNCLQVARHTFGLQDGIHTRFNKTKICISTRENPRNMVKLNYCPPPNNRSIAAETSPKVANNAWIFAWRSVKPMPASCSSWERKRSSGGGSWAPPAGFAPPWKIKSFEFVQNTTYNVHLLQHRRKVHHSTHIAVCATCWRIGGWSSAWNCCATRNSHYLSQLKLMLQIETEFKCIPLEPLE